MHAVGPFSLRSAVLCLMSALLSLPAAYAGGVTIASPAPGSANPASVRIDASANERGAFHLELWDNGTKLEDVFASAVSRNYPLSQGSHVTTILAVSNRGVVLDRSSVSYQVTAAIAEGVAIASPAAGSTSIHAVRIEAAATGTDATALSVWDNGYKLGDVFSTSVDGVYVLPTGFHTLSVQSLGKTGNVLAQTNVSYTVAEACANSASVQCDMEQQGANNAQSICNPAQQTTWIANPCGYGVQGDGGAFPASTLVEEMRQSGALLNQGNTTLNGRSLHLGEVQAAAPTNVLFRGESPTTTSAATVDTHWTLDEYVYLPDPTAHQAFEIDAQATIGGIWSKFYTECAFNLNAGTGFWGVFDTATGGWIFLDGRPQNGQSPPIVPCNRSQFAQPWSGSSNPAFTGWHHIVWQFLRNEDGTVTYESLTFDRETTQIGFKPDSNSGGNANDNGKFSALVQLDGVVNTDRKHNFIDAYIDEVTITHTP